MYHKLENLYPSNGVWRVAGICPAWGMVCWLRPLPLSPITPSLSTADIGGPGASLKFPSKAGGRGYLSPVPSPQDADGPLGGWGYGHITPTFDVQNERIMTNKLQKWIGHPKIRRGGSPWGPKGPKFGLGTWGA